MVFELQYTKTARKALIKLPPKSQAQIKRKLAELCDDPYSESLDIKPMKGEHYFRLRVGNYRVLYDVQHTRLIILVLDIGHRQHIYKD